MVEPSATAPGQLAPYTHAGMSCSHAGDATSAQWPGCGYGSVCLPRHTAPCGHGSHAAPEAPSSTKKPGSHSHWPTSVPRTTTGRPVSGSSSKVARAVCAGHASQSTAPRAAAYARAPHTSQYVAPANSACLPAGHLAHVAVSLSAVAYEPAGHGSQLPEARSAVTSACTMRPSTATSSAAAAVGAISSR